LQMSVDRTIEELSGTLAQLGQLVGHINGQINGITSRINVTLDNFDRAITNIATDAGSVTGQVGDTVSQIPNSWVFYVLFITLIIVFILLSVVLFLNLITKVHGIYRLVKGKNDGSEASLINEDHLADRSDQSGYGSKYNEPVLPLPVYNPPAHQYSQPPRESPRDHVAISMEAEPRRPGRRGEENPYETESTRPYQRRGEESGKYNLETATTSPFPRTIQASDI
ncbi:hypothetical protein PFISCL1PPCAC_2536, partial [Pristionchus fissidentatus]